MAITAVPEAAHRAATTESIAAASGPPRSMSSTTISRGPADARCRAALSRSSGPARGEQPRRELVRCARVTQQLRPDQATRLARGR